MTEAQTVPDGHGEPVPHPYDFRTGSELSREALSQLRGYSERLAGALGHIITAYLDSPCRFEATDLRAHSLDRLLADVPSRAALGIVELASPLPAVVWVIGPALIGPIVGRMLGGPPEPIDRPATMLEAALLRRFLAELVDIWATTWDRLGQWQPQVTEVVTEAASLPGKVREGEMVVTEIAAEIAGERGEMRLALPVVVAHRLVGEQRRIEEKQERVDERRLCRFGARVVVPVSVIVQTLRMPLSEVMELQIGDVIELNKPLEEPLLVAVRGKPKFLAQTGVVNGRLAARLIGPYQGAA